MFSLYVGYILMQIPSNMIINKISRPSWYIGAAMLLWGCISTLSGVVHDFGGMVATRFFLGFVEVRLTPQFCSRANSKAAFLPGALLILSKVSRVFSVARVWDLWTVVHSTRTHPPKRHSLRW